MCYRGFVIAILVDESHTYGRPHDSHDSTNAFYKYTIAMHLTTELTNSRNSNNIITRVVKYIYLFFIYLLVILYGDMKFETKKLLWSWFLIIHIVIFMSD